MDEKVAKRLAEEVAANNDRVNIITVTVNQKPYTIIVAPTSSIGNSDIEVGRRGIKVALLPDARLSNCPTCKRPY